VKAFPSLLLVDDDEVFSETLARELGRHFSQVRTASSAARGLEEIAKAEPDVLLLDLNLGDADGLDVLGRLRQSHPGLDVIILTAFGTVDAAVEAMRAGAFDFVTKPLKLEALVAAIRRAAERRVLLRENVGLRHMLSRQGQTTLVGTSAAVQGIRAAIEQAGRSDAPVLITGPSGAGKELVARAIHAASARGRHELITVNCASLQESLLESELFGHEKGAFTGATEQRPGLFEAAHGTTLFLDEIAELPLQLQAKLLRAIQFGEIRRVGGVSTLRVDVRVLAATNRDLGAAVDDGAFREDLYYRINVLSIRVPPLRERPEDVEPLFRHLAERIGLPYALTEAHFRVLRGYAWPGNVREMENLIERLKFHEREGPPSPELLLSLLQPRPSARPPVVPLADLEREAIEAALQHFQGDRQAAAEALGISVRTLYYRLSAWRGGGDEPA